MHKNKQEHNLLNCLCLNNSIPKSCTFINILTEHLLSKLRMWKEENPFFLAKKEFETRQEKSGKKADSYCCILLIFSHVTTNTQQKTCANSSLVQILLELCVQKNGDPRIKVAHLGHSLVNNKTACLHIANPQTRKLRVQPFFSFFCTSKMFRDRGQQSP